MLVFGQSRLRRVTTVAATRGHCLVGAWALAFLCTLSANACAPSDGGLSVEQVAGSAASEASSESEEISDESSDPTASEGETGGSTDHTDTTETDTLRRLHVWFTTVSYGGEYATRNGGAVWIEQESGAFVKTLLVWSVLRAPDLLVWMENSMGDRVDAVTGATQLDHSAHRISWDGHDTAGEEMDDGDYVVRVEYTEDQSRLLDLPGPLLSVPFVWGDETWSIEPSDDEFFVDVSIRKE